MCVGNSIKNDESSANVIFHGIFCPAQHYELFHIIYFLVN